MSQEVKVSIAFSASKSGASVNGGTETQTFDMAGSNMTGDTQTVLSASWNALSFGAISGAPSGFRIKNLDSTNYIQLSADSGGANPLVKLTAGKTNFISPVGTVYAKANSANVKVQIYAAEA